MFRVILNTAAHTPRTQSKLTKHFAFNRDIFKLGEGAIVSMRNIFNGMV
jgi:hypothetical protein